MAENLDPELFRQIAAAHGNPVIDRRFINRTFNITGGIEIIDGQIVSPQLKIRQSKSAIKAHRKAVVKSYLKNKVIDI